MSEEVPIITKAAKEKDPRRVASGKRLAAVSKLAKEKKAYERQQQQLLSDSAPEGEEEEDEGGHPTAIAIAGGGVAVGLVCLYMYCTQRWGDRGGEDPTTRTTETPRPTAVVTPRTDMINLGD